MASTQATSGFEIVWVETGRKISRYLKNNIRINQEIFPTLKRNLVVDRPFMMKDSDLNVFLINELKDKIEFQHNFLTSTQVPSQKDFWFGTSFRFMALLKFMEENQARNVLHLESDCVLLNKGDIADLFSTSGWELAYPLQAEGIGCASILLIRNTDSLRNFCEFMKKRTEDEFIDDMKLLGEYAKESNNVQLLPTSINTKSSYFYDAQSIGRYYIGTDARNCRYPFSTRGLLDLRNKSLANELENEILEIKQDHTGEIRIKSRRGQSCLVNIHIHSKRIPSSHIRLLRVVRKSLQAKRSTFWRIGTLDLIVFAERSIDYLARRISLLSSYKGKRLR